jgi:putative transposase
LPWLDAGPVPRPPGWLQYVDQPQAEAELAALRSCVHCNAQLGPPAWKERTAALLGLESSLRRPGRPPRWQQQATQSTLFAENEP